MIAPTMSLNLNDFKANFFSRTMQRVQRGQKKNLSRLGGWIRLAARRSIKNAGKRATKKAGTEIYSKPGNPPFNKTGLLKAFLLYAYDQRTESVVVGPAQLNRRSGAPEALEHGGKVIVNVRQRWRQKSGGLWVKEPGLVGPQAKFIRPRPFMNPALQAAKKEKIFEAFWQDSI